MKILTFEWFYFNNLAAHFTALFAWGMRANTFLLFFGFCLITIVSEDACAQQQPQRLSNWLQSRTVSSDDFPQGLEWLVPGEKLAQEQLRAELLKELSAIPGDAAETSRNMQNWLAGMPITGRVPISIVDADWLRANPNHDPIILPDHTIRLPKRPDFVVLMTSQGNSCQLKHASGHIVKNYLAMCAPDALDRVDWAWVIQPDGKVSRFGIASWNSEKQDEPAPGAWIWLPLRQDGWAHDISRELATFLATQGVAKSSAENSGSSKLQAEKYAAINHLDGLISDTRAGDEKENGQPIPAQERASYFPADPAITANDWGGAGLMQSPTARMRATGFGSMTLSRTYPYSHTNFFLQPLDWVEVGFRYSSVSNRLYGPSIAGEQAYKDKSIDVKLNLKNESAYFPQVAIGLRDITGTGLFSGEYIVANKRHNAFDWSLGMGWGYMGARANMRNPLGLLSSSFDTPRKIDKTVIGEGGTFAVSNYFRGPVALFGGVQYQTAWEPLVLKLEYDGNDYQHEPQSNNQKQNSPINFGAVYRAGRGAEVALSFERGNTLTLGLTIQSDMKKMSMPKLDDPAPVMISAARPPSSGIGEATAKDLAQQTGWIVSEIEQDGRNLRVSVDEGGAFYRRAQIDRANAVLHRDAPPEIDEFTLVQHQRGMPIVEHVTERDAWVQQLTQALPPSEQREPVTAQAHASVQPHDKNAQTLYRGERPMFEAEPGFGLRYNLGGPDGFILYQIYAEGRAKIRFNENTWLQGGLQLGLLDNYDKFKYTAPSNLPRVRTYIREYLTSSKITMPNLQLTHMAKISDNQYVSAYAGYLENMFAGAGAEWLYRPLNSPVAVGIDVNRVRQRDFEQDFALRDYRVSTGHATLYWDTGWNDVQANLSAGRYLAGDVGVTVELSRVFQNGVRIGGYFSKTNVSAEQFGEGSFDKCVYVNIPFDALLTKSSTKMARLIWKPLIRDGGAKLAREVQLYEETQLLEERALQYRPAELENDIDIPSRRKPEWGVSDKLF